MCEVIIHKISNLIATLSIHLACNIQLDNSDEQFDTMSEIYGNVQVLIPIPITTPLF